MRKVVFMLCGLIALGFSALASAQGYYSSGNVTIDGNMMYGSMNNRYSTIPTTYDTYIFAYSYANGSITFGGKDGDGDGFSCYVPTTSALYAHALEVKNNLNNGVFVNVQKGTGSSECTSVFSRNASYFLD